MWRARLSAILVRAAGEFSEDFDQDEDLKKDEDFSEDFCWAIVSLLVACRMFSFLTFGAHPCCVQNVLVQNVLVLAQRRQVRSLKSSGENGDLSQSAQSLMKIVLTESGGEFLSG